MYQGPNTLEIYLIYIQKILSTYYVLSVRWEWANSGLMRHKKHKQDFVLPETYRDTTKQRVTKVFWKSQKKMG